MKDKLLASLIRKEVRRQQESIDLIPSENIVSEDMLRVVGSPLMNKYSEGYPGRRYYPGNEFYDEIERLACARGLEVFHLRGSRWRINVQPYSGSTANAAIYFALMKPGDTLLGMKLSVGGHLTHGHSVNFSGKIYTAVQYGVGENERLDYDEIARMARRVKPKVIVSGLTAYPRKINFRRFGEIARSVGAYHVADISHIAGLIAGGVHPSPFGSARGEPHADVVMSTTHKTMRGPRGAVIWARTDRQIAGHPDRSVGDAIDRAVFPGMQGGPHNNITAARALMFDEMSTQKFRKRQKQTIANARMLARELHQHGFSLVTGGTDNHLLLVNLRESGKTGIEAERALEEVGILANRNSIPGDTSPFSPMGIRMGTPAITTRGMGEKEIKEIGSLIADALLARRAPRVIRRSVTALCKRFPIYKNLY